MKIIVEKNNLKEVAGKAVNSMLVSDKPLLFLTSGGSSLALLDFVSDEVLNKITIGMLDDRYSTDPEVNSYSILKKQNRFKNFLDSSVHKDETLEQYADRYERYILDWIKNNPDGEIKATIGIGPDGHTSGVLPFPENPKLFDSLFNSEKLILGYDVGNKNPHRFRMTSTFSFMRKFNESITYISGDNKKEALTKVLADKGSLAETPGRIVKELKNVEIFTDIVV